MVELAKQGAGFAIIVHVDGFCNNYSDADGNAAIAVVAVAVVGAEILFGSNKCCNDVITMSTLLASVTSDYTSTMVPRDGAIQRYFE